MLFSSVYSAAIFIVVPVYDVATSISIRRILPCLPNYILKYQNLTTCYDLL